MIEGEVQTVIIPLFNLVTWIPLSIIIQTVCVLYTCFMTSLKFFFLSLLWGLEGSGAKPLIPHTGTCTSSSVFSGIDFSEPGSW